MDITIDEFLLFCDRTIDGMVRAASRLTDAEVTMAPDLPGANSPYRLVTHALGACAWWTGHIVCGHESERNRDAEFNATGSVADLAAAAAAAKEHLRLILPELRAATELRHEARTQVPLEGDWTVGAALLHAYEELAQHLGHLEITVDLLISRREPV